MDRPLISEILKWIAYVGIAAGSFVSLSALGKHGELARFGSLAIGISSVISGLILLGFSEVINLLSGIRASVMGSAQPDGISASRDSAANDKPPPGYSWSFKRKDSRIYVYGTGKAWTSGKEFADPGEAIRYIEGGQVASQPDPGPSPGDTRDAARAHV